MTTKRSFLIPFRYLLLLVIYLSAGVEIYCQQPGSVFDHITTANGLSSNGVTDVIQDGDGFYWIATNNGLNRFDGTNFKIFHNDPADSTSLIHNHCNALMEDNEGNIWIATMKGISCFVKKQNRFQNYTFRDERIAPDDLNRVFELLKDDKGNIWAFGFMLMKYDTRKKEWIDYSRRVPFNLPENLDAIKQADYDVRLKGIWIVMDSRLFLLIPANDEIYHKQHNPLKWEIFMNVQTRRPRTDANSRLWFHDTEKKMISFFSPATNSISSVVPASNGIRKIKIDKKNRLWIFFWNGPAILYDHETATLDSSLFVRSYPGSILNSNGSNLYVDRDENYWIASNYGVSVLNSREQYFKYYRLNDKIKNADATELRIEGISEGRDHHLWVTTNHGLYSYNIRDNSYTRIPHPVPEMLISAVFLQTDSLLWLSPLNRIQRYNVVTKKIENILPIVGRCNSFTRDSEDRIWANTWSDGLYCFDASGKLIEHLMPDTSKTTSLKTKSLIAFEPGRQPGVFWIGYNGGLGFSKYDSKQKTFEHYRILMPGGNEKVSNTITSILEEVNGNLFLGTYGGGLYYYDRKTNQYTNYLQSDGLYSNFINAIFADKRNNLWISTSAGLNYFNRVDRQIISLPLSMALLSNDYLLNACRLPVGGFVFFSQNTFVTVEPDKFSSDLKHQSSLVISSIKIFDDEIPFSSSQSRLSLSHRQNFFSFEFSLLKTNPALHVRYAYQLKGFDKGWNYVVNRNAVNYTNVPPGRYIFLVKATNQTGQWMYESIPVAIVISPPFWKTIWFWMLVGVLVVASLYWFYRNRLNQVKRIYEVRNKISRDLHDDIGATLSGIAMYSHLTREQIRTNQPEQVARSLDIIQGSATEMVEKLSDIVWVVNPQHDSLQKLLHKLEEYAIEMASVKKIKVQTDLPEKVSHLKLPMQSRRSIYLVCKEAINNAVKYSDCSLLQLKVKVADDKIDFSIKDNGRGFSESVIKKGNGLINMEQRAREIGAILQVDSGPGEGTTVALHCRIPH